MRSAGIFIYAGTFVRRSELRSHPPLWRGASKMPDRKSESQHAEDVGHDRIVSGVDLPAAVEGNPGSHQHEDSSKLLHALPALLFVPLNLQLNRAAV